MTRIPTTEFIIKAVADALSQGVLPALEPASWPAGNLRACLMLLAYAEDRVKLEGPALIKSNAALRGELADIASGKDMPPDSEIKDLAIAVLNKYPAPSVYTDVADLEQENAAYQEAVVQLIKYSHGRRSQYDSALYRNLRARLDHCAAAAAAPDNAFVERALTKAPI
jgi:hypothetical protein